jgi:dienelactone hydrolase
MKGAKIIAAVIVVGLGLASANAQTRKERFEVDATWRDKAIKLKPEMHIPATPGPHGTVLIVNSSAGANDIFFSKSPDAFARQNIITVTLDTFTPRGIGNTVYDQSKITTKDMNLDALKVLERLRSDGRVKQGRIAIMGHSRGGIAAVFLASAGWYGWAGVPQVPNFDAGIALAPDCSAQTTGFMERTFPQFLAIMGEKDDYTVPKPCIALFQSAQAQSKNVEFHIIKGANHGFSTGPDRYDSQIVTLNGCADDPIVFTASDKKGVSMNARKEVAVSDIFKVCGKKGAHLGGSHEAIGEVLNLAGAWLKARGW